MSLILPLGQVFAGKYRVDSILGQGGMGTVYLAEHLDLGERVAIKVLNEEVAKHDEAVQRFINEAKAAMRIKSEHIAKVLDFGRTPEHYPYMVLEYLEGEDLSEKLTKTGPFAIVDAADMVLQALEGLAKAHALGIVHRDLKPANLFISKASGDAGHVKVLDFGISKTVSEGSTSLTSTRSTLGSPTYMSPEQLRSSKSVDARADIWSVGVILYELLTGSLPFDGETVGEVFSNIIETQPKRPTELRAEIPAALEIAILRCLEKKPENRFASVAELAEVLATFGREDSPALLKSIRKSLGVTRRELASVSDLTTTDDSSARALPVNTVLGEMDSSPHGAPLQQTHATWGVGDVSSEKKGGRAIMLGAAILLTGLGGLAFVFLPRGSAKNASSLGSDAPRVQVTPPGTAAPAVSQAPIPVVPNQVSSATESPLRLGAANPTSSAIATVSSAAPPVKSPRVSPKVNPLKPPGKKGPTFEESR